MPQPLNRVVPNGEFRPDTSVLNDKPELAKLVARIFALWGFIEHSLSVLLVRLLGADAEPAIAMFATLTAQRLQMAALKAAAMAALSGDDFDVFCAAISVTDSVQTPRNHLAHWIWGNCEQLPDALLLAEPKAQKDRDQKLMLCFERAGEPDVNEIIKLDQYDPATVLVYRRGDLERAMRDLEDAQKIAALLTVYLNRRLWQVPTTDPEWARVTAMHDALFQHLYDERVFREALDRIRADRQDGE
jgi:hypothetical protein